MLRNNSPKIAIYPGTFDPITNGHLDIIQRGVCLFDQLIIGVARNTIKTPFWPLNERVDCIHEALIERFGHDFRTQDKATSRINVIGFDNLLVDCAKDNNARVIIRGLRQVMDFNIEFQMCLVNHQLSPDIETLFLVASEQNRSIASSVVKEIAELGGDISSFVPQATLRRFKNRRLTNFVNSNISNGKK